MVIVSKHIEAKTNLNISVIKYQSLNINHTQNNFYTYYTLNRLSIYAHRMSSFSTSTNTVDGRNPAPVEMKNIQFFAGFIYKR